MKKIVCRITKKHIWKYNELFYELEGRKALHIAARKCKRCLKSELIQIIESFPEYIHVDKIMGERL